MPPNIEAAVTDQRVDNPIRRLDTQDLERYVINLHKNAFETEDSVSVRELLISAAYAKFHLNHELAGHDSWNNSEVLDQDGHIIDRPRIGKFLGRQEWQAYKTQADPKFWKEPKDLLVTMLACCLASFTQGWDQMASGNLGWPEGFHLNIGSDGAGGKDGGYGDYWILGGVNCITWFSAAILGPFLVDPICQLEWFGRRGAVCIAALFSFASMVGGSRATSWEGYLVARLYLGIGIGAKASIVPIWESEILPPAKRGRLLVSWQFFTATGIFAGSLATFIFRTNWRNQVLSGAIPALILLIVTYLGCESPRWLILHGKYNQAFEALVRLRKNRLLALEELCYIHFLIQAERSSLIPKPEHSNLDLGGQLKPLGYFHRLWRIFHIRRNKRAAIATMIVMLSQQLSGINILGFLSSIFFSSAGLRPQPTSPNDPQILANTYDSLRFSIGFGAANAVFSSFAYFLIEPLTNEDPLKGRYLPIEGRLDAPPGQHVQPNGASPRARSCLKFIVGRRALLISSLGGGSLMLLVLTFLLRLDASNDAKMPTVILFTLLFTLFYSPGAGCVPFLYSAEVWPNEGREVGMSWAVFWNFFGAGILALFVPLGLKWSPSKLFGIFTALSAIAMILVYLFVPGTDRANSLEDMSQKFEVPYGKFMEKRIDILLHPSRPGRNAPAPRPGPQGPQALNGEPGVHDAQVGPVHGDDILPIEPGGSDDESEGDNGGAMPALNHHSSG